MIVTKYNNNKTTIENKMIHQKCQECMTPTDGPKTGKKNMTAHPNTRIIEIFKSLGTKILSYK